MNRRARYSLPDGTSTDAPSRYIDAWKAITEPLEKRLGVKVYGFDPDLGVCTKDGKGSFSMPLWFAKLLVKRAES